MDLSHVIVFGREEIYAQNIDDFTLLAQNHKRVPEDFFFKATGKKILSL